MLGFTLGVMGLFVIAAMSVMTARAEESLRSTCRRRESVRQMQQRINLARSRLR